MAYNVFYPHSVEADRRLLKYKNYDDYLDSLVQTVDLRNLRNTYVARLIAGLGYRSTGITFSEKQFKEHQAIIQEIIKPKRRPFEVISIYLPRPKDPLMAALADREEDNRLGRLNTVIFLRKKTKPGFGISAYIDYAHRLAAEDWTPYFKEEKNLEPLSTDLDCLNWKANEVTSNITDNFEPFADVVKGLFFENIHDHIVIQVDPQHPPGTFTTRTLVDSPLYAQVILYDHLLRKKL